MPAFLGAHPEALPAIQAALGAEPPESYATCAYNSIHSFRWIGPDATARWVRYRLEPEAGESSLSGEEARKRGRDYLQEELISRAETAFRLLVVVAEDGDAIHDPTIAWPGEREHVDVGRLVLDGPETERERGDDILVFDPTRVTDGIELSDDPILRFRPRAYSVSVDRREARSSRSVGAAASSTVRARPSGLSGDAPGPHADRLAESEQVSLAVARPGGVFAFAALARSSCPPPRTMPVDGPQTPGTIDCPRNTTPTILQTRRRVASMSSTLPAHLRRTRPSTPRWTGRVQRLPSARLVEQAARPRPRSGRGRASRNRTALRGPGPARGVASLRVRP